MKNYNDRCYENKAMLKKWYKTHTPEEYPDVNRPRYRWQCEAVSRPCPFVSCKYHLYLDVVGDDAILFNQAGREPWEMQETCALDLASKGGMTREKVGEILNVSQQAVEQMERKVRYELRKTRKKLDIEYTSEAINDCSVSAYGGFSEVPLMFAETEDDQDDQRQSH
jgi:hypothetical protein